MKPAPHILALVAIGLSTALAGAQQNPPATAPQAPPATQQPPPATQQPPPATQQPPPRRPAAPRPTQVAVRDVSGTPLPGAKSSWQGLPIWKRRRTKKGPRGIGPLKDGMYRLRFELEGYVTLERDVTVRAGQPAEIFAALRIIPKPLELPPPAPPVVERAASAAARGVRSSGFRVDSTIPRQELHRSRAAQGIRLRMPRRFNDTLAATA